MSPAANTPSRLVIIERQSILSVPQPVTPRSAAANIAGSHVELAADLVITALGFDPEDMPRLFDAPELGVTRWGTIAIDFGSMMTSLDGVFAAGDIVRGASLVVWAVRDGRDAAEQIHLYLKAKDAAERAEAAE